MSLLDPQRLLALSELARHSVQNSDGDTIELGVYKGGSAAAIAAALREDNLARKLHLCDTFEGMPETLEWEFHNRFDFAETSFEEVAARLKEFDPDFPFQFHRGLFSETLPSLSACRFSFAHVDADIYQSVLEACEFLYPRMAKGGIILFDDYGAPTCPGAKKAVDEFFADKVEKPNHVCMSSYAVCIGSRKTDFHRLLVRRTFLPALLRAASKRPVQMSRRAVSALAGYFASPRMTSALFRLFSRGRAKKPRPEFSVREATSILVARQDTIGDLVLMSAFLRELRLSNPTAWITLVVDPAFRNLVELCPYVNEVLGLDLGYCGRPRIPGLVLRALRLSREHLWPRRFDLALVPRWDVDLYHSAYLARFSGASCRIGYSEDLFPLKKKMNRDFDALFTRTLHDRSCEHEMERNLDLLREAGGVATNDQLELWLSATDRETVRQALTSCGVSPRELLIGIAPGAGDPKRIWPLHRFIELARGLRKERDVRFVIVGGLEDRSRASRLASELGRDAITFAGDLTLRQTAALLERTRLVIANDSGPMHMAAAVGSAVVEISCHPLGGDPAHKNSPVRFHPWAKEYVVVQPAQASSPCTTSCEWHDAHCILAVSVAMVADAARELLANQRQHDVSKARAQT